MVSITKKREEIKKEKQWTRGTEGHGEERRFDFMQEDQGKEALLRSTHLKTDLREKFASYVNSWGVGMFQAEGTANAKASRQEHIQVSVQGTAKRGVWCPRIEEGED